MLPPHLGEIADEERVLAMRLALVHIDLLQGDPKVLDDGSRVHLGERRCGRDDGSRAVRLGRHEPFDDEVVRRGRGREVGRRDGLQFKVVLLDRGEGRGRRGGDGERLGGREGELDKRRTGERRTARKGLLGSRGEGDRDGGHADDDGFLGGWR